MASSRNLSQTMRCGRPLGLLPGAMGQKAVWRFKRWADDSSRRRSRLPSARLPDLQESRHCQAAAVLPVAADDDVIQKVYSEQSTRIPYGDREGCVVI
jgi:hypothetical protein